jgi:hypothetical protein
MALCFFVSVGQGLILLPSSPHPLFCITFDVLVILPLSFSYSFRSLPLPSWSVGQYNEPPWGDAALRRLGATVRTMLTAVCIGPDVLAFWKALGFVHKRQSLKKGRTVDVYMVGHCVQVLVSRLLVSESGEAGPCDKDLVPGPCDKDLVPGYMLVEAWTAVDDTGHQDAIVALEALAALVAPLVRLAPLPSLRDARLGGRG